MKVNPRRDSFSRMTDVLYEADGYTACAICGRQVYWPREPVGWDHNNQICHVQCVEERAKL